MQRFGRSDQRWRDRWGGGFLVATVLALVGAWAFGSWLSKQVGGPEMTDLPTTTHETGTAGTGDMAPPVDLAGYPQPLTVYFLQAGAFSSPERARQAAEQFGASGLAARVSLQGNLHKVLIGAYGTQEAATAARHRFLSEHDGLSLFTSRVEISAEPAVTTSTAAQSTYEQGVAALNGFLHVAANWWDGYAGAAPASTADLAGYAAQVSAAAAQLQGFTDDYGVNGFLALAQQVQDSSAQMEMLGQNPDSSEQFRAAMNGYLTLVDEYRTWAETGG